MINWLVTFGRKPSLSLDWCFSADFNQFLVIWQGSWVVFVLFHYFLDENALHRHLSFLSVQVLFLSFELIFLLNLINTLFPSFFVILNKYRVIVPVWIQTCVPVAHGLVVFHRLIHPKLIKDHLRAAFLVVMILFLEHNETWVWTRSIIWVDKCW